MKDPTAINRRLNELDEEWDIERCLETNAASVALIGLAIGATTNRKWFQLPIAVAGFLLQHALQDWCPPLPVFRRLGFRTQAEIERERYALKGLRGDFRHVPEHGDSRTALADVNRSTRSLFDLYSRPESGRSSTPSTQCCS